MTLGNHPIYKCPICEESFGMSMLRSGNLFGAKRFSDGKLYAPMMPESPKITVCEFCGYNFWIDDYLEYFTEMSTIEVMESEKKYPLARFLNLEEYIEVLKHKLLYDSSEKEYYIREQLWWAFNDRVRDKEELFQADNERSIWEGNIHWLHSFNDKEMRKLQIEIDYINTQYPKIELLELKKDRERELEWVQIGTSLSQVPTQDDFFSSIDEIGKNEKQNRESSIYQNEENVKKMDTFKIIIAEIHRNMGDFDKCMEIINSIENIELKEIKKAFEIECEKKNDKVFVFDMTPNIDL